MLLTGSLSLLAWAFLLLGRNRFWLTKESLDPGDNGDKPESWPSICAIIPARNEAEVLPETLPSVLTQDYPGKLEFYLVDDHSDDGTGTKARELAEATGQEAGFQVLEPPETPEDWTGKVWALHQGFQGAKRADCDLIWLTDADINHSSGILERLVSKLTSENRDAVSVMADLSTRTFPEKLLIPNFVYFFRMLYPFSRVNDRADETAAAAGGCVLFRKFLLEKAGGFRSFRNAIIDDCALARTLRDEGGNLWLGLSHMAKSIRSYGSLSEIWKTISRSAFSQLNHSFLLLFGTVIGMFLLFLVPPAWFFLGLSGLIIPVAGINTAVAAAVAGLGGATWLTLAFSFFPILNWYDLSAYYSLMAPLGGVLYTLMTVDSALSWLRGEGGKWKGRQYE